MKILKIRYLWMKLLPIFISVLLTCVAFSNLWPASLFINIFLSGEFFMQLNCLQPDTVLPKLVQDVDLMNTVISINPLPILLVFHRHNINMTVFRRHQSGQTNKATSFIVLHIPNPDLILLVYWFCMHLRDTIHNGISRYPFFTADATSISLVLHQWLARLIPFHILPTWQVVNFYCKYMKRYSLR